MSTSAVKYGLGSDSSLDAPPVSIAAEAIRYGLGDLCASMQAQRDGSQPHRSADSTGVEQDELIDRVLSAACAQSNGDVAADGLKVSEGEGGSRGGSGSGSGSIYVFNGVDYRTQRTADDDAAFTKLTQHIEDTGAAELAEMGAGKRRRHMSDEEAAAHKKELQQLQQQATQAKLERAQTRKLERWRKAGYSSLGLPLPTATMPAAASQPEGVHTEEMMNDSEAGRLHFVVGDAMAASTDRRGEGAAHIVLVWADDSGRWPSRGFFGVVNAVSPVPQAVYEASHEHGDLVLGDAHLVDCNASRPGLWVCLMAVLKRDKKAAYGTPPTLCTSSLDQALLKVAAAALTKQATVHSPRLSAAAGGGSWYAAERLLRKRLSAVETSVYYYARPKTR